MLKRRACFRRAWACAKAMRLLYTSIHPSQVMFSYLTQPCCLFDVCTWLEGAAAGGKKMCWLKTANGSGSKLCQANQIKNRTSKMKTRTLSTVLETHSQMPISCYANLTINITKKYVPEYSYLVGQGYVLSLFIHENFNFFARRVYCTATSVKLTV